MVEQEMGFVFEIMTSGKSWVPSPLGPKSGWKERISYLSVKFIFMNFLTFLHRYLTIYWNHLYFEGWLNKVQVWR
jgi:hypothetical protein